MGKSRKTLEQSKGNLTVLQQEQKKRAEASMNDLETLRYEPPYWLDDTAKEEYERILPQLRKLPIKELDLALVSAYCQAFSDYINATIRMNNSEAVIETERGTKLNQNHAIKRDALSQLNSIAPKIGMSIDSRLKIFTPKEEEKNNDRLGEMFVAKNKR